MSKSSITRSVSGCDLKGKYCEIFVGDKVRSWDFEPRAGQAKEFYIEGYFIGCHEDGRMIITVEKDTLYKEGARKVVLVPQDDPLVPGEWSGRITKL